MACTWFICNNCGNTGRYPTDFKRAPEYENGRFVPRWNGYICPKCNSQNTYVEWEEENEHGDD